jgi:hypothetical protein
LKTVQQVPLPPPSLPSPPLQSTQGKQQQQQLTQEQQLTQQPQQRQQEMERKDALVDHLAAEEPMMLADEAAGHAPDAAERSAGAGLTLHPAHSAAGADAALSTAADAALAAAAQLVHVPVAPGEAEAYRSHLGAAAYLVAEHAP